MKTQKHIFIIITIIACFLIAGYYGFASVITSGNDGNWTDINTWDLGRAPADNDTVVISAGDLVTLDESVGVFTNMRVEVYGDFYLNANKKLKLDSTGVVQIYAGGTVDGASENSRIIINGVDAWDADNGLASGPAFVQDGSSGGFESGGLPIQLASFEAALKGNVVEMSWSTATELNNDYFTIERSADGNYFEAIGNVVGAGNSNVTLNYTYTDYNPYQGASYYRIKQTDYDGRITYSNKEGIIIEEAEKLSIFPVPSDDGILVISLNTSEREILIVVYDIYGNEHFSKVVLNENEGVYYEVDMSGRLASGVYLVRASANDEIYEKKIVIK